MKKLFIVQLIIIALLGALPLRGQTNTNTLPQPYEQVFEFLSQGSNWIIAPYGTFTTDHHYGGGLALGYHLNDFMVPFLRLDYLDYPGQELWMPSGSLQLQAPINLSTNVSIIPFVVGGIATPIQSGGAGVSAGTPVGIFGGGADIKFSQHFGVLADWETWSSFPAQQIRVGFHWRF
jgi:hypothetical protein